MVGCAAGPGAAVHCAHARKGIKDGEIIFPLEGTRQGKEARRDV